MTVNSPEGTGDPIASAASVPSPLRDPELWRDINRVYDLEGEPMRVHRTGRGVWRLDLADGTYFLKRFWLVPKYLLKRSVARGLHELATIDWLNANGFRGPEVVARGVERRAGVRTRMYFVMRAVPGEAALSQAWLDTKPERAALLADCAAHVARLHRAGFHHYDMMTQHVLAARGEGGWRFRHIDVERASVGRPNASKAARDLLTLACSIRFEPLRGLLLKDFLELYLAARPEIDARRFRRLHARLRPNNNLARELRDPIVLDPDE